MPQGTNISDLHFGFTRSKESYCFRTLPQSRLINSSTTTTLFSAIKQRVVAIPYRRFGTTCRFHLQQSIDTRINIRASTDFGAKLYIPVSYWRGLLFEFRPGNQLRWRVEVSCFSSVSPLKFYNSTLTAPFFFPHCLTNPSFTPPYHSKSCGLPTVKDINKYLRNSAFVKYLRKSGNTRKKCISSL